MKRMAFALALLMGAPASAQESRLASDWRREREHIAESCSSFAPKALTSCAVTLVTGYPFHLALGSLAPKNGFGFGLAFAERYTPNENWRISFNADAVRSTASAWRAGGYVTFIRTKVELPGVSTGPARPPSPAAREYPVFRAYVQHTTLPHMVDFGPDFANPQRREFREKQTILGGSAVMPINQSALRAMALSLSGGANGRFVTIDTSTSGDNWLELFEDVRVKPALFNGGLKLNYGVRLNQFLGGDESSFHRWTVDLRHEIPLYRTVSSPGRNEFNGPNECFTGPTVTTCPPVSFSRNRGGSIGVRLLTVSSSSFSDGRQVPFYFQPTIGGSDINGQRLLPSLDDYRFRAPHVIAAQVSIEHSIWGPLGAYLSAERGKAVQQRSALNFDDLLTSYSAGLSLRAGGAPVVTGSWSWGSSGTRLIVTMDASLLGGAPRPSLF
jgi:hypothetical protein